MYTDPPTSWTRDTKTPSSSFGVCCNPHNKDNNHSEREEKVRGRITYTIKAPPCYYIYVVVGCLCTFILLLYLLLLLWLLPLLRGLQHTPNEVEGVLVSRVQLVGGSVYIEMIHVRLYVSMFDVLVSFRFGQLVPSRIARFICHHLLHLCNQHINNHNK